MEEEKEKEIDIHPTCDPLHLLSRTVAPMDTRQPSNRKKHVSIVNRTTKPTIYESTPLTTNN